MRVIVVGCGRLGAELAYRLCRRGHEVAVVDKQPAGFNNLPADFQGRIIEGDVLSQDVLHRADAAHADALVAATNSDALNAVIGHVANTVYRIPRVVARNYDPRYRPVLEAFGLQVVGATTWGAQRMEELIYHSEIRTVFSAGNGEIEMYEVDINDDCAGRTLQDLVNGDECTPVSITRAGRALSPTLDMALQAGDVVLFGATFEGVESVRARMCSRREEA